MTISMGSCTSSLTALESKTFWMIGYNDCLPFKTVANLSSIKKYTRIVKEDNCWVKNTVVLDSPIRLSDNNYYFVELPQRCFNALKRISYKSDYEEEVFADSSCYKSIVKELNQDCELPLSVCNNIACLAYFKPFSAVPCATESFPIHVRDVEISELVNKGLEFIGSELDPNCFNEIVFFGGKPHVKYMLELNHKNNCFAGLELRVLMF